ncbi:major facilitator superfamily transporter [Fusarium mundagurra]|uniref:Major facilitator superfamily transporter n=1 Tax=Fusarium mundagurra TaxID=1567541 RepID=A0A8H6CY59_9HYPO|nr:major facilitator superfamily transporter [Fusarium mundagurra]
MEPTDHQHGSTSPSSNMNLSTGGKEEVSHVENGGPGNPHVHDSDNVTLKTWAIVVVLALSYGISFWPVSFISIIQNNIAGSFDSDPKDGSWFTGVFTMGTTTAFMVCGTSSDLFGRRPFILFGNMLVLVGSIIGGTSHSVSQSTAAHFILGFGSGNCMMASFALPELLPNKWKHIGVVIADAGLFFDFIAGPVVARIAWDNHAWRWGYWGVTISIGLSMAVLILCVYFPPKHPRGVPWHEAVRGLDYFGMVSFVAATIMILSGITYVQLLPSDSPKVVGLLVAGFVTLTFFALWEAFNKNLKAPLTPPRIFFANKGRRFGGPFLCAFVVTMFYYGQNIVGPVMINTYFTGPTTSKTKIYWMSTVQGWGIFAGSLLLSFLGKRLKHWRLQMFIPFTLMTFFGGMCAYVTPEREAIGITFVFLTSMFFGYVQYLSIVFVQFGADQTELGIVGGLGGVARSGGGGVANAVFMTILTTAQSNYANKHVVAAAEAAGATPEIAKAILAALPLGAEALAKIQGATTAMIGAAAAAFQQSFVEGIKNVSLASIGFGALAIIGSCWLEDIEPKMNEKIEVFLENDYQAEKNVYH